MKNITNMIIKIKHFINCLYYLKSSISKNAYPCKLVGEKINLQGNGTIILYKLRGNAYNKEIPLRHLLDNKKLIERFHPRDAIKLGYIAFKDVILELSKDRQENKFYQIKNIMLNSTHDIHPDNNIESLSIWYKYKVQNQDKDDYLDFAVMENNYPCKLVGAKISSETYCTIIIFTILGKREGYEKSLPALLTNKELLEKFHPTEAVKFGFISMGDLIFGSRTSNQDAKDINIEDLIQQY